MSKTAISPQASANEISSVAYSSLTSSEQEQIMHLQQSMLELLARGGDASSLISQICKQAESTLSNSVGTVMLVDKSTELLNIYAAPSIPDEGVARLNGLQPGPGAGSCGNAVFRKAPQYIDDTYTDPRWENMRQIAHDFNLCACWSTPVFSSRGTVLGTFALSSFEHRSPGNFYIKLLEIGSSLIGLILEREQALA